MNRAELLVKTLHGKRLSPGEKIQMLIGLTSEKANMLVTRELLAHCHKTKSQVIFQLVAPLFIQNTYKKVLIRV